MMRGTIHKWLGSVGMVSVATSALAATVPAPANDYSLIPTRNLFKLQEPVIARTNAPPPELPKVYLLGITTLGGQKRVYLKREAGKAGAGTAANDETKVLGPGEKDGDIEVLDINEIDKRVRIRIAGTEMDLDFEKNAPKSNPPANLAGQGVPPGNPPAEPTGQVQPPVQPMTSPGAQPGPNTMPTPGPAMKRLLPSRNLTPAAPPPLPGVVPGGGTGAVKPNPAAQQITPQEEQQILNELERLKENPKPY